MPNNVRDYLDFDLGFGRNPITNDLNKRINANAIKQSVKNLVLTHFYEVPFHPEVGSQIYHALFENFSPMTYTIINTNRQSEVVFDVYRAR